MWKFYCLLFVLKAIIYFSLYNLHDRTFNLSVKYKKMTRYPVQSRDIVFVKGYGFLSFTKNMGKNLI